MSKHSIVIPVKYGLEMTKMCIDSVKMYGNDCEIIIVNDGADETLSTYLRTYMGKPYYTYIENEESRGFPTAVNQGIAAAIGEYITILNNDACIWTNFLEKMTAHFGKDKTLGMLSCTSNEVNGRQHIEYNKDGVGLEYIESVMGIVMMLPREMLDKLKEQEGHYFDERFGKGGQEDRDISMRINKLDYKVGIARDVFVWHYGSYSFRKEFTNKESKEYLKTRVDILNDKYKEPMTKPLIFIAIPNLGDIKVELIQRLIEWSRRDDVKIYLPKNKVPLDNARCHCVEKFLEVSNNPDDRLLFIDDDIVPPFDVIDILVAHDKDVVGALCFMMKEADNGIMTPVPVGVRYNKDKKYEILFDAKGLTEIDATGGACIMNKRHVFEKIEGRPYAFQYNPDGSLALDNDFDFCQKVQKAGMKIYIDYSTLCGHIKPVDLLGLNNLMLSISK